jgi:putative endonuclease
METYYTYVLRSQKNGRLYTGSTDNIERRLAEHNAGHSKATRHLKPFALIYKEQYYSRAEAYRREMYLKTGRGREELRQILGL